MLVCFGTKIKLEGKPCLVGLTWLPERHGTSDCVGFAGSILAFALATVSEADGLLLHFYNVLTFLSLQPIIHGQRSEGRTVTTTNILHATILGRLRSVLAWLA